MPFDLSITAPGVYDIPSPAYHAQICDAPSISSTGLRLIRSRTPRHYWAASDLNPDAPPAEWSSPLNFGSAAHSLLLEGDLPESQYAISPFNDFRTNDATAWRDSVIAAGRIVVTAKDLSTISAMRESLAAHPMVRQGLFSGQIERSIFWKRDDFWLKARPDVIPADGIVADLKTVADASPTKVVRAVADYGYHMQAAMIVDGLREVTGSRVDQYAIVSVEKEYPHVVSVATLSDAYLIAGRMEYEKAFQTWADCLRRQEWPDYGVVEIDVPGWLEAKLEREAA